MKKPKIYCRNADLLREIGRSKSSYCWFRDPADAHYSGIVSHEDEITPQLIAELIARSANAKRIVDRRELTAQDLVIRVMSLDHIPLDPDRALAGGRGRNLLFAKTPFPPFRHLRINSDGSLVEVGRSCWRGDLETGHFDADGGALTPELTAMLMTMTERISARYNWRGYSWIADWRADALLHLVAAALSFDESKSENPFAFYTSCIQNDFIRSLKIEKRHLRLRDDLLIDGGLWPSLNRQLEDENSGAGRWYQ